MSHAIFIFTAVLSLAMASTKAVADDRTLGRNCFSSPPEVRRAKGPMELSGIYAIDFPNDNGDPWKDAVWFAEDDASSSALPSSDFRSGVLVFDNQRLAKRLLPPPARLPKGICRIEGKATLVIRDFSGSCPGVEAPDGATLGKVLSSTKPK